MTLSEIGFLGVESLDDLVNLFFFRLKPFLRLKGG